MFLVVTIAIGLVNAVLGRLIADELANNINRFRDTAERIQKQLEEIGDALRDVEENLKRIHGEDRSLWCLADLPSDRLSILARCPYDIEDIMVDIFNGGSEQVLGLLLADLGKIIVEIKKQPSRSQPNQENASSDKFHINREKDKEAVLGELMRPDVFGVAIIGIGGIGKKALAQSIADDAGINCIHMFINSSNPILLDAVESLDLSLFTPNKITPNKITPNKIVLILLPDLQSVDPADWNDFRSRLKNLNPDFKVLITSQNPQIADQTSCYKFPLDNLPEEECFSLILKYSKVNQNLSMEDEEVLQRFKTELGEKCKGLPLLAYHIGLHLSATGRDSRREAIVDKYFIRRSPWKMPELKKVLQNMRSVALLVRNPHLQRCVAYCSLFPKDHCFEKGNLVLLWMAEGFARVSETEDLEYMKKEAVEGFEQLISHSVIQTTEAKPSKEARYTIHDLIHELAQHLASVTSYRMHIEVRQTPLQIPHSRKKPWAFFGKKKNSKAECSNIRHLSIRCEKEETGHEEKKIDREEVKERLSAIKKECKHLRTFLLLDGAGEMIDINPTFFKKLSYLRVLDLSHTKYITDLSKVELKQLRYLDLSHTPIKKLPSFSKNRKLQVVKLEGCTNLLGLPKELVELTGLIHLLVESSPSLVHMPPNIGKVKYLETLDVFIVGKAEGCKIEELKEMNNLMGSLRITMLENVETGSDAQKAKLQDKKRLNRLALEWTPKKDVTPSVAKDVLEGLKPPKGLLRLKIRYYNGSDFPKWVGSTEVCGALKTIHLDHCEACSVLPPLGKFRRLKTLFIEAMPKLTSIGQGFLGEDSTTGQPGVFFPALKSLELSNLPELTEWEKMEAGCMPRLQKLTINECKRLAKLPPLENLKSLKTLLIYVCEELKELPTLPLSLTSLEIKECGRLIISGQYDWSVFNGIKVYNDSKLIYSSDEHLPGSGDTVGHQTSTQEGVKLSENQPTTSTSGYVST